MENLWNKYALVVGCNYQYTSSELRGCINDANSMYEVLVRTFKFHRNNIQLVTDSPTSQSISPTANNIKAVLNRFLSIARYNDVVFLYFAGHGTTVPRHHSSTGRDEQAIVTSDFNLITSMDFREILNGAPRGVRFIIMSDSCHSGGLIDKEQEQIGPHHPQRNRVFQAVERPRRIPFEVVLQQLSLQTPTQFVRRFGSEASLVFRSSHGRPLRADQGILLSGCQPNESSGEGTFYGKPHGVFTTAVLTVLTRCRYGFVDNKELVTQARRYVEEQGYQSQHPCLYSSDSNAEAFFLYHLL